METEKQAGTRTRSRRGAADRQSEDASGRQERIRVLAYQIYETRRSSGMLGDPVSDWLEAERQLSEEEPAKPRKSVARKQAAPSTRSQ